MLLTLLITSIFLQFIAAGLAFIQIRNGKHIVAWLVMSIALLLTGVSRSIYLIQIFNSETIIMNPLAESISFLISVLMVAGVWLITNIFDQMNKLHATIEKELKKGIEAEKEIKKHQEVLTQIGSISHIGAWELDVKTGQGTWSEEVGKIHDLDTNGKTFLEKGVMLNKGVNFYKKESREKIDRAVKEAIEFRKPYDLELEIISATGRHKWIRTTGNPIEENGKIVRLSGTFQDITKHKKNEETIHQITKRQEQLADIIEKSEQPLGVGYPDGSLGLCNAAFCKLTGYSMEELKKINWSHILTPPEWNDAETIALTQLNTTGKPVQYQKEYIHKDGHRIPIEMLAHVVKDKDGQALYYYAFITDITERIATEKALLISEKRFEDIALSSADWIWECDAKGKYTFAAGQVEKISGYTPSELIKMTIFDMMDSKESKRIADIFERKSINREPIIKMENTLLSKDGRIVYLLSSGIPVIDEKGKLSGYRGVNQDITDIKRSNNELLKYRNHLEELVEIRSAELKDLNLFNSTILETAPVGIVTYKANGQCMSANGSSTDIVGISREKILEQNFRHIKSWQESGLIDVAINCLETGEMQQKSVALCTSSGKEMIIDSRFARFMIKHETHLLLTFTDVTNRVRSEEALKASSHQLETANKELEAFAYSVSHDLRAPLRSIDGFSQAILEDYGEKLDTEGYDDLHRIRAAAQRMGELIEDLLQLSRISRWQLEQKTLDLSTLANEIILSLQEQQPDRVVKVVVEKDLKAEADPRLIRLVMNNLIGNAWKFSRTSDKARIEFGKSRNIDLKDPNIRLNDNTTVFYVKDNGVGFDMTYADKLFGAFQRLHTVSEFEGTGIGLATVMRAIQRQGGQVWAEGHVGKGATLYFSLET